MTKAKRIILGWCSGCLGRIALFLSVTAIGLCAQSVPQIEFAAGYSYMDFHANVPQLTSNSFNGAGGAVVFNALSWLGIKAEVTGWSFGSGWTNRLRELGYTGPSSTNMFAYQFGPQIKKHSGVLQPYAHTLYGVAHSSGYAAVLRAKGNGTFVLTPNGGNENAFAMELGGGVDIPVTRSIQLRPVEVDYQLTRFGFENFSANQSNFKYFGGINLTFGQK